MSSAPAAPHAAVGDAAVERRIGHVLDRDRVGVHVEHDQLFRPAGEHPVDVGATVDDLVEHHVAGAELGEARGEVVGERAFPDRAVVECLRSGLQRIDARDAHERRHRLGKLLGTDVHASV